MGILSAFVILVLDVILWLLPAQGAIQAFRTNQIVNTFTVTASGGGSASATLSQDLFNGDTSLVTISSNNTGETPVVASYDNTTRALGLADLTPSGSSILNIRYYADAFPNQTVWNYVLNAAWYFWLLILVVLPIIAIVLFVRDVKGRH